MPTRHPGYAVSLRKTRHKGTERVDWIFTMTVAAYNLVRLPKLMVMA